MAQILQNDKIGLLSEAAGTITLAASVLTIGGQQYTESSVDATPSVSNSVFYYVYTVRNAGVTELVIDISPSAPVGYDSYIKVGAIYTTGAGDIFKVYNVGEINETVFSASIATTGTITNESSDFLASATAGAPKTCTFNTGIFSVAPNAGATTSQDIINTIRIPSVSDTQVVVTTGGTVGTVNYAFRLICQKQGIDAIQPNWSL